jgi:uncharacterized protein YabE (DUF348 family)
VRRSIKWGIYVLVLGGIVAGTMAWLIVDKSVKLQVDGQGRTIHTVSRTVSGALDDAHVKVGEHDVVAPSLKSHISDGDTIVVRYGRLLHLVVDGVPRDVWVTAPTVEDALDQLGYNQGSYSSVSRDKRLPTQPTNIDLRTPKAVTIAVDGGTIPVTTTAATVADVVSAAGVTVGPDDVLSAPGTSPLTDGMTITIQRVALTQETDQEPIPFDTQSSNDATLAKGKTVIDTAGVNGVAAVVYNIKTVDGVQVSKDQVSSTVVTPPVTQVQRVGTMVAAAAPTPVATTPAATPTTAPTTSAPTGSAPVDSGDNSPAGAQAYAQQAMLAEYGWGSDQFSCLVSLWSRESGWRYNASNPSGAYGIPQALPGSKMGAGWQTSAAVQVEWGLGYIASRYGTPCGAWGTWQSQGWY